MIRIQLPIYFFLLLFQKGTELHEITSDQPLTNRESKQDSHKSTNRYSKWIKWGTITILNLLVVAYFAWATYHFVDMGNPLYKVQKI